ncbi:hypothetical protein GCM10022237_09700 [Nocardioides ginsengisoli]|uniref:Uncharacterized protein n=1 Tax=Nocardioides ginsengisoli TaxID=363868 RepID=A0ABW3VZR9_9ACTN
MGKTVNPAELITRNLRALHGALEHSVTIQVTRLQELMDDMVARGTLSRAEADHLIGQLVSAGKAYSHALLQVLDSVSMESRKVLGPVRATAGLVVETVLQAPKLVTGRRGGAESPPESRAESAAEAAAEATVADPLLDLDELTVAQVKPRLAGLSAKELRRVRDREVAGKNRKGVLAEIARLLD